MIQEYDELVRRAARLHVAANDTVNLRRSFLDEMRNAITRLSEDLKEAQKQQISAVDKLLKAEKDLASALEALKGTLQYEKTVAQLLGLTDCTCIRTSRDTERAYETGTCPHQIAAAELAKHQPTPGATE